MRTRKQLIALISMLLALAGCSHRTHERSADEPAANDKQIPIEQIAMNNNRFAFDLLKQIAPDHENVVMSPFSISTAMAMTYIGAREGTREQMAGVMHFDKNQEAFARAYADYAEALLASATGHIDLNIANALWAQQDYPFLSSYFAALKTYFGSEPNLVDFEADREQIRLDINEWVFNETKENIKDLIAPNVLTEDTRLVLVNAIHFLGSWFREFDKELTTEDRFYLQPGETTTAKYMRRHDTLPYFADGRMQALQIPYSGKDFSMVVLLPDQGSSLHDLEQTMDANVLESIMENMRETKLDMFIPRFEAESKFDLEKILAEMGMPQAFNRFADFSGMTGDLDLKIDRVIHQAMIEVAEEGTEAAAATAVVIIRKTAIDEEAPVVFRADRPFMFLIMHNQTNNILFAGRVMNPSG